ncbi:MAG: hypothetical protein ACEQSR_03710 [Candidatus Methylacidiphilales bacterium]
MAKENTVVEATTTEKVTDFPSKEVEQKKEIFLGPTDVLVRQKADGEMFAVHETLYESVYKNNEDFELIKKK